MVDDLSPWADRSNYSSEWVLAEDREIVEKFQAKQGQKPEYRLRTDVVPEPWCGPIKTARVLLLAANPHWDNRDDQMPKSVEVAMWENLSGERPLYCLDPQLVGLTGGDWYRERLLKDLLTEVTEDQIAREVCLVDLVGYRSHNWNSSLSPSSSLYTFRQVRAAVARKATIVVLRSATDWLRFVPELGGYGRLFFNSSWQQVRLSRGNTRFGDRHRTIEANGYEQILSALS